MSAFDPKRTSAYHRLTPSGILMRASTMLQPCLWGEQFESAGLSPFLRCGTDLSAYPGSYNETFRVVPSTINRFASSREMEAAIRIVALRDLV
jgi:hypothetical protein